MAAWRRRCGRGRGDWIHAQPSSHGTGPKLQTREGIVRMTKANPALSRPLRRVGYPSRALASIFALIIVASCILGILGADGELKVTPRDLLPPLGVALIPVAVALRSMRVGIVAREDGLLVTDWFSTRIIPYAVLREIRIVPYAGLLNWYNTAFMSTAVKMIQLHSPSFALGTRNLEVSLDTEAQLLRVVVHLRHLLRSQDEDGRVLATPDASAVEREVQELAAAQVRRSRRH